MALQVTPAPYQLPAAVSGETVVPGAGGLLLAGGADRANHADQVTRLDPVTGATSAAPIQALPPWLAAAIDGKLPGGRSGAVAVNAGSRTYLIGGSDGPSLDPAVLAAPDGGQFRVAARLQVPVSHAGAAAGAGAIWVFGGQARTGTSNVIQRIDLATGATKVAGHLPRPVRGAAAFSLDGSIFVAGGQASGVVYRFDPATASVTAAGELPVPVADAGAAVTGGVGYLIGGDDGTRAVPAVTTFRLVPSGHKMPATGLAPWLQPAAGPARLAPGSDPSALPADVLIADHRNNRLLIVDPQGRVRWEFPRPGDLAPGQTFLAPDDAFFSPDGKYIVATQEDDYVITVISVATSKIVYRYGVPGASGAGPNHLFNPDDAMMLPGGMILAADIKNCRVVLITPPAHVTTRVIGRTTQVCEHAPPSRFGSPNGAFPLTDGRYLVTEINGDWVDEMSLRGALSWSAHPPGSQYPSDTNEVYPGRYLTADYAYAGQIVEFDSAGRSLWRLGGFNHPSLALPLPNGDVLLNDDFNHRVCVVDPATSRIVWQYGHTGAAGTAPGYLNDPDGVDLVPPDSLLVTHAATLGAP
jgi:DNA-binding beta-propeller fold protein YncE